MFRLRRYRVYLAFAAITIFAFYHFSSVQNIRDTSAASVERLRNLGAGRVGATKPPVHEANQESELPRPSVPPVVPEKPQVVKAPAPAPKPSVLDLVPSSAISQAVSKTSEPIQASSPSLSGIVVAQSSSTSVWLLGSSAVSDQSAISSSVWLPEKSVVKTKNIAASSAPADPNAAWRGVPLDETELSYTNSEDDDQPTIYWRSSGEHFPVASNSLIRLPTATPKKLPKIQHDFTKEESTKEKDQRRGRLLAIREAFDHSWGGYKRRAWLHDELTPVTGGHKDPFCGWAATLVDSLDTLWILGLKSEFEKAVDAVDDIDFTTTTRNDIPIFETTIRYLGGLLAAYDISGAKYQILLKKAVELADVLMGAFDTPNRMPILYYRWKPAFASQPHRGNARAVLAELGSLSLEFTRLAQLTKEAKYYDAIARITNALELWQMSTNVPGLWPSTVDISGCNKSSRASIVYEYKGEVPPQKPLSNGTKSTKFKELPFENVEFDEQEPKPRKKPGPKPSNPLDAKIETKQEDLIGGSEEETGEKQKFHYSGSSHVQDDALQKRQLDIPPTDRPLESRVSALTGKEVLGDSDCNPQGLASPWKSRNDNFGIGGRSDSTYEYLPKEYILLGGLEEKYKTMYDRAVEAIKDKLLFRPLIPNEKRDILVAGTLVSNDNGGFELNPECTHLTCFAGGMIALASKIFGRTEDLELARKLTDGCVWAYEATKTGIMPEVATLMQCDNPKKCLWNQTQWHEALDPNWQRREEQLRKQRELFAAGESQSEGLEGGDEDPDEQEQEDDELPPILPPSSKSPLDKRHGDHSLKDTLFEGVDGHDSHSEYDHDEIFSGPGTSPPPIEVDVRPEPVMVETGRFAGLSPLNGPQLSLEKKKAEVEASLNGIPTVPEIPSVTKQYQSLNHSAYVRARIDSERLPPGFTLISDRNYKLRPEAIESVFIMYRVTGEEYWREKGWEMFRAIQSYTVAEYGNSQIEDVTASAPLQKNSMESFWLAETLKYFFLLFSDPDVVSLDEWVLNTEAHPFRRPDAKTQAA